MCGKKCTLNQRISEYLFKNVSAKGSSMEIHYVFVHDDNAYSNFALASCEQLFQTLCYFLNLKTWISTFLRSLTQDNIISSDKPLWNEWLLILWYHLNSEWISHSTHDTLLLEWNFFFQYHIKSEYKIIITWEVISEAPSSAILVSIPILSGLKNPVGSLRIANDL